MPGDMKAYLERLQIGSFEAADSGRFSFEQVLNKSFWGTKLLWDLDIQFLAPSFVDIFSLVISGAQSGFQLVRISERMAILEDKLHSVQRCR